MSELVRNCCRVNGLEVQEEFVDVIAGAAREPKFVRTNPLGKVPCLKVLCVLVYIVAIVRCCTCCSTTWLTCEYHSPLQEDNFVLSESAAIMRYLAKSKHVPGHWYPSKSRIYAASSSRKVGMADSCRERCMFSFLTGDPRHCAKVDSALDWYHGNVRLPAIMLTWHVIAKTMHPKVKPIYVGDRPAQRQLAVLNSTLKVLVLA